MPITPERRTSGFRRTSSALSGFAGGASLFGGKGVKFGISIKGNTSLIRKFNSYKKSSSLKMYDATKRAVLIVEAAAKVLITKKKAVDTGRLRGSIIGQVISYDVKSVEGKVGTSVFYGIYVHEGTVKMEKRRFLTEALDKNKKRIVAMMAAAIKWDIKATSLTG
jgi:HK97 gp10 family phage protein